MTKTKKAKKAKKARWCEGCGKRPRKRRLVYREYPFPPDGSMLKGLWCPKCVWIFENPVLKELEQGDGFFEWFEEHPGEGCPGEE